MKIAMMFAGQLTVWDTLADAVGHIETYARHYAGLAVTPAVMDISVKGVRSWRVTVYQTETKDTVEFANLVEIDTYADDEARQIAQAWWGIEMKEEHS